MADDKKNISPEVEKPGDTPQEKKTEPVNNTPLAPEQPGGEPKQPRDKMSQSKEILASSKLHLIEIDVIELSK